MRAFAIILGFFLLLGGAAKVTSAETADPHELFERRCARCHGAHAGEFAPNSLVVQEGKVIGRENGKELTSFLLSGHGRLAPEEVEPMVAHLTAILGRSGLFREKCVFCHAVGGGLLCVDVFLPIPSSIVITLLGARLGFWAGWLTAWVGLTLGNVAGYYAGRLWPQRWAPELDDDPAVIAIILSRPVPIIAEALTIACGAARVPVRQMLTASLIGNGAYTLVLAMNGALHYRHATRHMGNRYHADGPGNSMVGLASMAPPAIAA